MDDKGFDVEGSAVKEIFCGRVIAFRSGAVCGEFAAKESGKTKVNKAKWSAPCGIGVWVSAVCHFQPV
jgi:hypothetical protein